ncbi:MAG: hypothetical protein R3B95_01355 [Nitrospirales bacterium]|nr:hypothetical protein [Nitrospirales bacterium]
MPRVGRYGGGLWSSPSQGETMGLWGDIPVSPDSAHFTANGGFVDANHRGDPDRNGPCSKGLNLIACSGSLCVGFSAPLTAGKRSQMLLQLTLNRTRELTYKLNPRLLIVGHFVIGNKLLIMVIVDLGMGEMQGFFALFLNVFMDGSGGKFSGIIPQAF